MFKKSVGLELKQISLSDQLNEVSNRNLGITQNDLDKNIEVSEKITNISSVIFKENEEMREYFNKVKSELEILIQQLNIENSFLLKEHERIYVKNRNIESEFTQLKNEYKNSTNANNTFYKRSKEIINTPLSSTENRKLNKVYTERKDGTHTMLWLRNPIEKSKISNRKINMKERKYKCMHKAINISDCTNSSQNEFMDKQKHFKLNEKIKEKLKLNRFKIIME